MPSAHHADGIVFCMLFRFPFVRQRMLSVVVLFRPVCRTKGVSCKSQMFQKFVFFRGAIMFEKFRQVPIDRTLFRLSPIVCTFLSVRFGADVCYLADGPEWLCRSKLADSGFV